MNDENIKTTRSSFIENFGNEKEISTVSVPASLIILGDHTHYNDGIILSTAINRYATASVSKRDDDVMNIVFNDCDLSFSLSLNQASDEDIQCGQVSFGPLLKILEEDEIIKSGFNCLINSNIPSAIGLGGVTANHIAFLTALNNALHLGLADGEIIELARKGELNSIGKISNVAHHKTVLKCAKNSLLYCDIRKGDCNNIQLNNKQYKLVICDTDKIIGEIKDICNERISECKVGVDGLRLYIWGIKNLRDVNLDFLEKHIHMIPKRIYSRVLYNVSERIRVEKALDVLEGNDYENFSNIVSDSHRSLRNEYEIGSETLDFLSSKAKLLDGVISSKMISCSPIESTYNLVEVDKADEVAEVLKEEYNKKFGSKLITYTLNLVDGLNKYQPV